MRWLESLAAEAASLAAYHRAIARFPELTGVEERRLSERVRRRDEEALASLVASQLGLVLRYAQQFHGLGVPLADLVHDGNLALVDAARRFHPERHGRFAGYARWWIRQGLLHRLATHARAGEAGDDDAGESSLAPALRAVVEQACGAPPEDHPVVLDTPRDVEVPWRLTPQTGRLDEDPLDLDDLGALLADGPEDAVRMALASDLGLSLLELEPKERRALELRLGLIDGSPRTANQVGHRLRLSPARVERVSARAVRKLRRQYSVRSPLN